MRNKLWESTQVCPCLPLPTCARACPSALLLLKLSPLCLAHAGPTIGECNVCPRRGRRAQHHRRHRWQRRPTLVLITLCACACERVYICMMSQFHERARRGGPDLRSLYSLAPKGYKTNKTRLFITPNTHTAPLQRPLLQLRRCAWQLGGRQGPPK